MTMGNIMVLKDILEVRIPDSALAREVTEFIRDTESDLLFNHSVRVYCWGALTGVRKGMTFDPELLYTASMFAVAAVSRNIACRSSPENPRARLSQH